MLQTASAIYEYLYEHVLESQHHKSGLNTKSNLVNAGENP